MIPKELEELFLYKAFKMLLSIKNITEVKYIWLVGIVASSTSFVVQGFSHEKKKPFKIWYTISSVPPFSRTG